MKISIGLKEKDRLAIADLLQQTLIDSYGLRLKTQNYHWNITGPQFIALHELFEEHYNEMQEAIDEIAERIRILGPKTDGGLKVYAKKTKIEDGDPTLSWEAMVKDLVKGHELVIEGLRAVIETAGKASDERTVDLMVQRLEAHEKAAWMLRSHVE